MTPLAARPFGKCWYYTLLTRGGPWKGFVNDARLVKIPQMTRWVGTLALCVSVLSLSLYFLTRTKY